MIALPFLPEAIHSKGCASAHPFFSFRKRVMFFCTAAFLGGLRVYSQ